MNVVEIALFTDDVETTSSFYRHLVGDDPVAEWPGGATFAVGEATILVHARPPKTDGAPPNEDHFAMSVADLDAACAALEARGLTLLVLPRAYPWGRSAYLRDPDGRLIELAQA